MCGGYIDVKYVHPIDSITCGLLGVSHCCQQARHCIVWNCIGVSPVQRPMHVLWYSIHTM